MVLLYCIVLYGMVLYCIVFNFYFSSDAKSGLRELRAFRIFLGEFRGGADNSLPLFVFNFGNFQKKSTKKYRLQLRVQVPFSKTCGQATLVSITSMQSQFESLFFLFNLSLDRHLESQTLHRDQRGSVNN